MHTTLKNVELLKHFKISKTAPALFISVIKPISLWCKWHKPLFVLR